MKKAKAVALMFAVTAFGFVANASFLPEDVLLNAPPAEGPSQISEQQFNDTIARLQKLYDSIIGQFGGRLNINGQWSNDKLVARSTQMFGSWVIEFSGGLARRPELTPDGMALILCHELGHHVGGFPYMDPTPVPIPIQIPGGLGQTWAAAEGQADYYSTEVCAKKLWADDEAENMKFRDQVDSFAKAKCDSAWSTQSSRDICYRSTVGISSIMHVMADVLQKPIPEFNTPDTSVVAKTYTLYPSVQCRLDTVFAGTVCTAAHDDTVIPGKTASDFPTGLETEKDAAKYYCTASGQYSLGLRPACWYGARL